MNHCSGFKSDSAGNHFLSGLTLGLFAGTALGVTLCPTRREMKKMARKTAHNVTEAMDHLRDSIHEFCC